MGRYRFQLEPLDANHRTAANVQNIVYQDFAQLARMHEDEARSIANPDDPEFVNRQYAFMDGDPGGYFGVTLNAKLCGVIKLREWLYGDEEDFTSKTKTAKAKMKHKLGYRDESTMGLHVFARSAEMHRGNSAGVTTEFLDLAVEHVRQLGRNGIKDVISIKAAVDLKDYDLQAAFDQYPAGRRDGIVAPVTLRGITGTADVTRDHVLREAIVA